MSSLGTVKLDKKLITKFLKFETWSLINQKLGVASI